MPGPGSPNGFYRVTFPIWKAEILRATPTTSSPGLASKTGCTSWPVEMRHWAWGKELVKTKWRMRKWTTHHHGSISMTRTSQVVSMIEILIIASQDRTIFPHPPALDPKASINVKLSTQHPSTLRAVQTRKSSPEAQELWVTEAKTGDRLKSPLKAKKGEKVKWVHPDDVPIEFVTIASRPDVLKRGCATDTTIMVDYKTLAVIGTVCFGIFEPALLWMLQMNQEEHTVKNIKRRPTLDALAHGTMTSFWPSQPAGGAPLQTYGMSIDVQLPEGIIALFRSAMDGVALGEVARATVPGYQADQNELANMTDIAWVGTQVGTIYSCTNFMSCVHDDDDANSRSKKNRGGLLQPCMQTEKSRCKPGEFDFFYVHWGVRIQTETNCVWCFNATHLHASCIPSKSSMDSGRAVSRGQHKSARRKDALAATRRKRAADSFRRREAYFGTPESEDQDGEEEYDADEE
ncbi:hypothetical protein C8F01DRAFT_1078896 [Mycena amicta]|nr:hypothetical protein C8F01DRAFT_1078896 [Mycena amicta]